MPPHKCPPKLGSLEVGRALAALAVVLHHAELSANAFTSGSPSTLFNWGIHGVDFFFVLSGFIIFHVHQHDKRNKANAARFLSKRVRRIYLPYLPIGIGMAILYLVLPGLSAGERDWGWLSTLTLMPSSHAPALSVAWTLTFEMMFYLFFLLFYFSKRFTLFVAAWALGVALVWSLGLLPEKQAQPVLNTLLNTLVLEFIAGMLAAYLFRVLPSRLWSIPVVVGLAALAAAMSVESSSRVLIGLSLGPIVLGCAMLETQKRLVLPKAFQFLGAASYSIYLVHNPIQSIVSRALQGSDSWGLHIFACAIVGTLAGVTYFLSIERPALKFFARIGRLTSTDRANTFSNAYSK